MNGKQRRFPKRNAGLTLVELMVVVAIIGILTAVVQRQATRYFAKAKQTEAQIMLRQVAKFAAANDVYFEGTAYVVCTTASSCTVLQRQALLNAGLVERSPGLWTLPGERRRYRFEVGVCPPYGDCIAARAIDPETIYPGCLAEVWIIPEGKTEILNLSNCLD